MKYYKVISNKLCHAFDGRYYRANIDGYRMKNGARFSWQYIADELFTPGELKAVLGFTPENKPAFLQPVDIKKSNIHYFFGARFEDGRPIYYTANGEPFPA